MLRGWGPFEMREDGATLINHKGEWREMTDEELGKVLAEVERRLEVLNALHVRVLKDIRNRLTDA